MWMRIHLNFHVTIDHRRWIIDGRAPNQQIGPTFLTGRTENRKDNEE
jgi:hypothetical protein